MCLAVPGKLVEIDGMVGKVDIVGTQVTARLDFMEDARVGDYVLVHAGFAITAMTEEEALETLAVWQEAGLSE